MSAPVAADVVSFLSNSAGVTVLPAAVSGFLILAFSDLNRVTGYDPFIGASSSKRIQPKKFIRLPNGIYTVTSIVNGTDTWVLDTHFRYGPVDRAGTTGEPYEWIEVLLVRIPVAPLVITGKWGYADEYPADVAQAIIQLAAGRTLEAIRQGQLKKGVSWKEADASREYAGGSKMGSADERDLMGGAWIAAALKTFSGYARMVGWG